MVDMSIRSVQKTLALLVALIAAIAAFTQDFSKEEGEIITSDVELMSVETPRSGSARVERIVDGDTIVVIIDGEEEKVRLIGINTPETVDPRKEVECFGKEASTHLEDLLEGESVQLLPDSSQDDADRYGRLLRYIQLVDGSDVGAAMIRDGFAYEYTYDVAYEKQAEYLGLQDDAKNAERGLWSPDACNGIK